MAFAPENHTATYQILYGSYLTSTFASGQRCYQTGVNLPDGATITAVTMWYKSTTASSLDLRFYRVSASADSADDLLGGIKFVTDSSGAKASDTFTVADAAQRVVDNRRYSYGLGFCSQSTTNHIIAARITYTYTSAGD